MSEQWRTTPPPERRRLGAMGPEELRRRAISKALAMGGAGTVARVRYGTYRVASRTRAGLTHTVSVVGQNFFCTCPAGAAGRPCWHAAAVFVAKIEAHGARVTGPGTQVAPAEAAPDNVIPLKRAG